jgi:hypothetical protein
VRWRRAALELFDKMCGRYFRAFRRMDKTKPFFPNYTSKKQPTGVLWDNKFRSAQRLYSHFAHLRCADHVNTALPALSRSIHYFQARGGAD